jgi:F0F1-type ATP synthase assembly protein I
MFARDPATRRLAARILTAQAATTIVIAALCLVFAGRTQALSALAGGGIGLTANAYMLIAMMRTTTSAAGALGTLATGQLLKMMLTVGGLLIVARGGWASWPALLSAYAATVVVYWLVPVLSTRARRPRD